MAPTPKLDKSGYTRIDAATPVYCVIGDPVAHSLSPLMINRAFAEIGYHGVYVALRVSDLPAAITGIRAMGVQGASVTIPHKVAVMPLLDQIDPMAVQIGAVNTIVNRGGRLMGHNTDCSGAMAALAEQTDLTGKRVWIIGAGGAARAVGFGVRAAQGHLTILNRSRDKGQRLARELGADFMPLATVDKLPCDVLINTTSVGMTPNTESAPVDPEQVRPGTLVMDIIYNPLKTRLLAAAEKQGARTIDGVSMFAHQGAAQIALWTGLNAPLDVMRQTVTGALQNG